MFTSKPNYHKLRTNLKLCINRLKLLEKKKTEQALKARKEIADYIAIGKDDRARIRVEHIIREDYMVEAMEIIEMLCDLILARFGLIEKMSELDPGLETAIATIIWITPRLSSEILELKEVTMQLVTKYGKEFGDMCRQNNFHNVHEKVIYKMNIASPPKKLIENYMIEIAKSFKIPYEPEPLDLQDNIPNSGDLLDLAVDTMPSEFAMGKDPSNHFSNNDKHLEASGFNGGVNNLFSNDSKQDAMLHFDNNNFYDNKDFNHQNDFFNNGSTHVNAGSVPPPLPNVPPNSGNKTLTSQITWDNEELPQLPPYESVIRHPFNYPTVPTGNQYPNPIHAYPNATNFLETSNVSPFEHPNNQPSTNNTINSNSAVNNGSTNQNLANNSRNSNSNPLLRMDKMGGVPVFPKLPDLPGFPSIPTDSLTPSSNNDDIEFDDLSRRFEELKKRK